jgi:hypothetical protein
MSEQLSALCRGGNNIPASLYLLFTAATRNEMEVQER